MLPAYAERHCLSNFTFLRGASHPQELIPDGHLKLPHLWPGQTPPPPATG